MAFTRPDPKMGTQGDVLGLRIAAFLIDAILFAVVSGVVFGAAFVAVESPALLALVWLLGGLAFFAYFIYFEGTSGQTVGKRVTSIVVVREDGRPLGYGGATIRTLLRIVDALPTLYLIGLLLILVTDDNQRLGDLAADSVVVRTT
ncbi:RDD family protein [Halorarius litoreus]|uniref:RDD family protein n=1 Tax=Halorarius litoreus TaxID=2962676 RepID=UPI0020CF0245|nr:RDD family protein [Halorarius litoreus]